MTTLLFGGALCLLLRQQSYKYSLVTTLLFGGARWFPLCNCVIQWNEATNEATSRQFLILFDNVHCCPFRIVLIQWSEEQIIPDFLSAFLWVFDSEVWSVCFADYFCRNFFQKQRADSFCQCLLLSVWDCSDSLKRQADNSWFFLCRFILSLRLDADNQWLR